MDAPHSPQFAKLQQFHTEYVAHHSSPMRKKFLYEFGAAALGEVPSPVANSLHAPIAVPDKFKGRTFETTNQYGFRAYGDELKLPSFCPEVKHRVMKSPTHDYTEAMFREWNIHGKPPA